LGLVVAAGCAEPPAPRSVDASIARAKGRWGVYFHDLRTGDEVALGADETFHAASTMKVLVLVKVFRDIEDGKYSLEDRYLVKDVFPSAVGGEFKVSPDTNEMRAATGKAMAIADLCRFMMVASDNLATNVLIEIAGGPSAVTDEARRHGLEKTSVARYIEDQAAFRSGISSHATAREMGRLLEKMWRGEVVSAGASRRMLEVLAGADRSWMGLKLPADARVAHKTGAIERTRHDVGIVTMATGRSFVLCVYSDDLPDEVAGEETISGLARLLYDRAAAH
jgi:beta-lactamase class A